MAALETLTFRIATLDDFDEVVQLSNDSSPLGHDYLQLRFHSWLEMDNRVILLAFLNGRLIGLQACFIVDDGRTFVRQAMRLAPDFQGKGFSRELSKAMDTYVVDTFPNVCRVRLTTYRPLESSTATRMILELDKLNYQVVERVSNGRAMLPSNTVTCSKQYFCDVILSRPCSLKLFPSNVLVVDRDWCPFEALQSNIDYILQEGDFLLVEKCVEGEFPKSFSFGRLSPKAKLLEWVVSVYADDPATFADHVIYQFNHACQVIKGEFSFTSFQEKRFRGHVQKLLEEQLQLKHADYFSYESLFLYERDFGKELDSA